MKNNLPQQISVLFIVFLLISLQQTATRAQASEQCAPSQKVGFNLAAQTRGSVVTLCGRFVAQKAATVLPKQKPAPSPKLSKPQVLDPQAALKLFHRKLARAGETSFSPSQLLVLANPVATKPNVPVAIRLAHHRQYRTAYLVGRFVSLRFTPTLVTVHLDAKSRLINLKARAFEGTVRFLTTGYHAIRAIVTYQSEYRLNGSKDWIQIAGIPQLAAVPARVLVSKRQNVREVLPKPGKKPLLVANDCLLSAGLAGCLN